MIGLFCDEIPLSPDQAQWDYYMGISCFEFTGNGQVLHVNVPMYDHGCIADYPEFWPSFSGGINYELWDLNREEKIPWG